MSNINPAIPTAAPRAEGLGWDVAGTIQGGVVAHVLRDDGVTFLGCYIERASYSRAAMLARLNASAGITAGETARIASMAASTNW
jgi:hypothetical protein